MAQTLYDLLHRCTVKVSTSEGWGTGFFVAPGLVLTCAHVVVDAQQNTTPIEVFWSGRTITAQIKEFRDASYPDIVLLKVDFTGHPCVLLYGDAEPFSDLYSSGYPDNEPHGASTTFACQGWAGEQQEMLRFKQGQARPGMSGSPLLNRETGSVCGIVQVSYDTASDLGGKALLSKVIFREFPGLEVLQKQYHQQHREWIDSLTTQQRQALGSLLSSPPTRDTADVNAFEIFYSYAEEDEKLVKELQKQLILLKRRNLITDWHAGKIALRTGEDQEPAAQILSHLNSARIILLLVSPDYIFSETLNSVDVKRAMERHKAEDAIVIPVLLRPTVDLEDAPFGKLLPIPRNRKPVSTWQNRDEAFAEVAKEIRGVVEELKKQANPRAV